jgi:cytoskeletal protein CcmA (bactofilin family)
MNTVGPAIRVVGELFSGEDVVIAGHVEGPVICERASVVVQATAEVEGDVIARDVTVHGRVSGRLLAGEFVDIAAGAQVTAAVMTPRFILADGAQFNGRVEPQHLEAALKVFWFERQKRGDASQPAGAAGA